MSPIPTKTIAGQELVKAMLKLRTSEEIELFLSDILSPKEIQNISNRWHAVTLLSSKNNYLDIQKQTGLSSATVAKMSTSLKYGSGMLKTILERL